ncbi:MAG: glycoside hydrolase family 3 C-terminal domain-containing protein, partial [Phaeodactylibacter sp.]|nr:glycoside hydrolase family 3 C-terminal domain-containing protein [Phaeodactylibacter sp.]
IELAREVARKSIVLLKNKNNALPLKPDIGQIYVTGHNAADVNVLIGNYFGVSSQMVTILEGIAGHAWPTTVVQYSQGLLVGQKEVAISGMNYNASNADATVAVIGLSPLEEGEQGDAIASSYDGDRERIELPAPQMEFIKDLRKRCGDRPLVVVVCGGSAMAFPEIHELADAVLWVGYPGEQGGNALGDVLFGNAVPSGKLPVSFVKRVEDLPPFDDYALAGRTYRYMDVEPLFPFGFGLSYTKFEFSELELSRSSITKGASLKVLVSVTNTGDYRAEEVVQLYLSDVEGSVPLPKYALKSFQRVKLWPGETKQLEFEVTPKMLEMINEAGEAQIEPGQFKVYISSSTPSQRSMDLGATPFVEAAFSVR